MRFEIKPKDLGKFEAALAKKMPGSLKKARERAAKRSVEYLQSRIRSQPLPPIYRRRYINGWTITSPRWGAIAISNKTFHSVVIEKGRRVGAKMPPRAPIEEWVRRKLKVPKKRVRAVAYIISVNMVQYGLKPKYIVFGAMPRIRSLFAQQIEAAYDRVFVKEART